MKYAILIEKTDNGYSAYAPDLPGCVAAADTRAEVEELIREAIVLHLESLREHGEPIPEPQTSAPWSKSNLRNKALPSPYTIAPVWNERPQGGYAS